MKIKGSISNSLCDRPISDEQTEECYNLVRATNQTLPINEKEHPIHQ